MAIGRRICLLKTTVIEDSGNYFFRTVYIIQVEVNKRLTCQTNPPTAISSLSVTGFLSVIGSLSVMVSTAGLPISGFESLVILDKKNLQLPVRDKVAVLPSLQVFYELYVIY